MFTRILAGGAAAATLALALSTAALAQGDNDAQVGPIEIGHAWARATPPMAPAGGGFLELKNTGATADALIAAKADVSERTELHTHIKDGDVMKMRQVERIDIPAGGAVALQPGSFHVMFIGLKKPLAAGESFPVTLTFEKAGSVTVPMKVNAIGTMTYDGGMGGTMGGGMGQGGMQHGGTQHGQKSAN